LEEKNQIARSVVGILCLRPGRQEEESGQTKVNQEERKEKERREKERQE